MLSVRLICVGKLKEKYLISAVDEYKKRLGAFCRFEIVELNEERLPDSPTPGELNSALEREAENIIQNVPKDACLLALCVEGKQLDSPELARFISEKALSGKSRLCFVIGGSFGLSERVKKLAELRLSMSRMTFPHHLARVMLAEQIYRAFTIIEGRKYHK